MYLHPVKKILGLTVLYSVIIVGIFLLQFRNESVFSKSIGMLHYALAKTGSDGQPASLKNKLQISFRGLEFTADDKSPVIITRSLSNSEEHITLISYNEATPQSCSFNFSEGVSIICTVNGTGSNPGLSLLAKMPESVKSVSIPYKISGSSSLTGTDMSSAAIETKGEKFELHAGSITKGRIVLTSQSPALSYVSVMEKAASSPDAISSFALANEAVYSETVRKFKASVISAFNNALQDNKLLTEQSVTAYVATMAENGQYNQALDTVPDSFKKSQKRTYLSAPYFGALTKTNASLQMQMENYRSMMSHALEIKSCDIFTVDDIATYLCQSGPSADIRSLLQMPSSLPETAISLSQMAGILHTYTALTSLNQELAVVLEPVIKRCTTKILSAVSIANKEITLSENGTPLSPVQAVEAGDALIQYGLAVKEQKLVSYGYFIVNSYLSDTSSMDIYALAEIYPALVHNNTYYPHFAILKQDGTSSVWAWTCASSLSCVKDADGVISLAIDFPQGLTHYLFITGIKPFSRIQIYGMDFRTDPRFETYNSSGYVYLSDIQTLLLKSRQKSEEETIRIFPATDYTVQ
jgi:hypothetical protein